MSTPSDDPRAALERMAAFADSEPSEDDIFADPRWDEVAAGTASEATLAELRELAEEAGMPEALDLFAPPSEATAARMDEAVAATLGGGAPDMQDTAPAAPRSLAAVRASKASERRPLVIGVVAALAVAAAAAFYVRGADAPEPVAVAWPAYEATLSGGEKPFRADDEPSRFRAESEVTVELRPDRTVEQAPALRAWVVGATTATPLPGEVKTAATGAIRFRATLPASLPSPPVALWLLLGDEATLPAANLDRAALEATTLHRIVVPLPLVEEAP